MEDPSLVLYIFISGYIGLSSSLCFLFLFSNYVLVEALGSIYTNPIIVKSMGSLLMHNRVHTQTKQGNTSTGLENSLSLIRRI